MVIYVWYIDLFCNIIHNNGNQENSEYLVDKQQQQG